MHRPKCASRSCKGTLRPMKARAMSSILCCISGAYQASGPELFPVARRGIVWGVTRGETEKFGRGISSHTLDTLIGFELCIDG